MNRKTKEQFRNEVITKLVLEIILDFIYLLDNKYLLLSRSRHGAKDKLDKVLSKVQQLTDLFSNQNDH